MSKHSLITSSRHSLVAGSRLSRRNRSTTALGSRVMRESCPLSHTNICSISWAAVSTLQRTLLGTGEPTVDLDARFERIELDDASWIDVAHDWLLGADTLLD